MSGLWGWRLAARGARLARIKLVMMNMFFRIFAVIIAGMICAGGMGRGQDYYFGYSDDGEGDAGGVLPAGAHGGSEPTVPGRKAFLHNGVAYAPEDAPAAVKRAIWAANGLRRKPYKWSGGHGSFEDSGYDCSGTVSYMLHGAGVLGVPMESSDFYGYGEAGAGRWITIYVRPGHAFAVVAGLRLDTTGAHGTEGPRWHTTGRDLGAFAVRHPVGL